MHWDGDGRKDLLVGRSDGKVSLFLNVGSDASPTFDGGTLLQVGPTGGKTDLDVGSRATPRFVDWDADGRRDLVVGALDGRLRVYRNEGTDSVPDFLTATVVQDGAGDLLVPSGRSSPVVVDVDYDGRQDLLVGNTSGQLLLYRNVGSPGVPRFAGFVPVLADGLAIDLPGSGRGRPSVADWSGDGLRDVLVGYVDGKVHLYQGVLRVEPLCFGDGSLVACPCGNESAPGAGEGCAHAGGVGARLTSSGTHLVARDDLVLHVAQGQPKELALVLQGASTVSLPFTDGVLCLGAPTLRLELLQLDAAGGGSTGPSLAARGGVAPEQTVYYQVWYRSPNGPCGTGANLSAALRVDWR